tara:strand:- start:1759 stop:1950 length:192 start_codon:yes stop_codon:yes gene_type:complete
MQAAIQIVGHTSDSRQPLTWLACCGHDCNDCGCRNNSGSLSQTIRRHFAEGDQASGQKDNQED